MSYVEKSVQCPYNPNHIILKSRLITHLCKCRKQHGVINFSICPFNATHRIPTPELQYHVANCPDQKKLHSYVYVVGADNEKKDNLTPVNMEIPASENWEDGPEVKSSYLDLKDNLILKKPLLRLPVGQSKSQRRQFFANEVQRFENLRKGEGSGDSNENSEIENSLQYSSYLGTNSERRIMDVNKTADLKDDYDCDNSHAIVLKNIGRGKSVRLCSSQE